jgi:hypothetical protein
MKKKMPKKVAKKVTKHKAKSLSAKRMGGVAAAC